MLGRVRAALRADPSHPTAPTPLPPPAGPDLVAVPAIEVEPIATLTAAAGSAWAMVTADGHSYKAGGDVSDVVWWAIKTVRFEAGELDPYDPGIRRLDHGTRII